jgi:hypothetical protein
MCNINFFSKRYLPVLTSILQGYDGHIMVKAILNSGNKLTQSIDEQGNLVGVKETVDFESREVATEEETKMYNEQVYEYNKNKMMDDDIVVTEK